MSKFCKGKAVLDIPCGMGWGTSLIRNTIHLFGIDISHEAIQEANRRYNSVATFHEGSMDDIKLQSDSLDVVVCLEGIEHVSTEIGKKFIRQAKKILRKNGILLLSSPYCENGEHSGNPYHVHEYQPDEIRRLLEDEFDIHSEMTRAVGSLHVKYFVCHPKKNDD